MSDGFWEAHGSTLIDPDGHVAANFCTPHKTGTPTDAARRLNGPSPAEVAALLREIQRNPESGCCVACGFSLVEDDGGCGDDCKLDAMIKQCEGA